MTKKTEFLSWLFKNYYSLLQKYPEHFLQDYILKQQITDLEKIVFIFNTKLNRRPTRNIYPFLISRDITSVQPISQDILNIFDTYIK